MSDLSSLSSSEEEGGDDQHQVDSMKSLADVLWQKIKNDRLSTETSVQESDSQSESESEGPRTKPKLAFTHLHELAARSSSPKKRKQTTETAKSPSSTSTGNETDRIVRSLQQRNADKALKEATTKSVGSVESERQRKKQAKEEKSQWNWKKGSWGAMKIKERSEEDKRDLMVLNMRSTIDPTHHYKHNDLKNPKFFQVGTVEESSVHFYHDRIPKKKRKRTLLDELMADEEFKRKTKQRYAEVVALKTGRKALYHSKPPSKVKLDKGRGKKHRK